MTFVGQMCPRVMTLTCTLNPKPLTVCTVREFLEGYHAVMRLPDATGDGGYYLEVHE